MKSLFVRYRELVSYVFWGGMTTMVNYAAYFLFTDVFHVHYLVSNVIAWAAAVAFAFLVNKLLVFQSKSWARSTVFRELWQFLSARILSGVLETGILWFFVDLLHFNDDLVKIAASVLVVILNYGLSKWIIFRKNE